MNLFFFDLETTGLGRGGERVVPVQLAGIVVDPKTLEEKAWFETFIKIPDGAHLEEYAMNMHRKKGRDYEFFQHKGRTPAFTYQLLKEFLDPFGKVIPAGHNAAGYDFPILRRELTLAGIFPERPETTGQAFIDFDHHVLDTMTLAIDKLWLPGKIRSVSLAPLAEYLGVEFGGDGAHDALSDVRVTIEVYRKLRELPSPWVKETADA